jgi:hypothetical protein
MRWLVRGTITRSGVMSLLDEIATCIARRFEIGSISTGVMIMLV